MQTNPEILGSPHEEYHVASRNQAGLKHVLNAYRINYSIDIRRLVVESSLTIEGRPRAPLEAAPATLSMTLGEAINERVSSRRFTGASLSADKFSAILMFGNAIRQAASQSGALYQRPTPNSGGLGSTEVFPIVLNVNGFKPGIYHFDSVAHDLAQIRAGDFRLWLKHDVFYQPEFANCSAVLLLTAAIGRLTAKYGSRGYRLALLDAGHVSQNIYLCATALELQVCATAGFIDDRLDAALGIDGRTVATMLAIAVGP